MSTASDGDSPDGQTKATVTVDLRIFGADFHVRCAEADVNDLTAVAHDLDERLRRIRDGGNVTGMDRLAVIAALNIGHENLHLRQSAERARSELDRLLARLDSAIEMHDATSRSTPLDIAG